jgi:predicted GIY-YIG superfamily endonuclease
MNKRTNMKKYYVYNIVDENNKILYIGETTDTVHRLKVHTNIQGKFYKRKDIKLVVISEFKSKKEAFDYQLQLQKENGFETDLEKLINNGYKGSLVQMERFNKTGIWKRAVKCYDYKTKQLIAEFESTRQAGKILNVKNIDKVLNGTYKRVGGYYFQYA